MLKFMVVAVTAYGMATLEGPTLAIKSVNSLSHYTDWTIAHVHTGALGWNGFLTFAMLYWLFPRLYNTKLWSTKLANYHFWIALLGMMFYVVPMYVARRHAGLDVETVHQGRLPAISELPGNRGAGSCRCIGCAPSAARSTSSASLLMAFNLYRTAKSGQFVPDTGSPGRRRSTRERRRRSHEPGAIAGWKAKPLTFTVLAVVAVLIGGLVEIIPMFLIKAERARPSPA